ncbi:hypothetical protein F5880DRAFT_927397 [Lentinula raphanica]|nr:hypothetical protein F5880DRAFT_927397 [Lentinula raphanica]
MSAAACNNDAQPKQKHVLRSVHSLDTSHCSSEFTPSSTNNSLLLGHDLSGRQPSKGILKPSPPPSPSFVSISSRSSTSSGRPLAHSRSLQFASPYRSPPASPTINGPPPPVPPLPAFVFTGAEKEKDDDEEKDSKEKGEKEAMKEKPKKRRHSRAGVPPTSHPVLYVCTLVHSLVSPPIFVVTTRTPKDSSTVTSIRYSYILHPRS